MKAKVKICRDLATLRPPLRWRWYVILCGSGQHGHLYAYDKRGSLSKPGAVFRFLKSGIKWLVKAWTL